ncbi:MAG: putative ABC transporter permease [Lachnospiraceae bacterium]|nr:putative ABC transporter permease [Lachnospiraceae bacterium]
MHIAPEFLEVTKLQMIECFVFYSILGWFVESLYMSFCTKKLTNRGFGFGPFCPIYGFGATLGAIILSPFRISYVLLFIVSAISATLFEYIVGRMMQFSLGDFWWDYTEKPFNYQGIICLESTLGWGLYGIIVVKWLHPFVLLKTTMVPVFIGRVICYLILALYMIDFTYHVLLALHIDLQKQIARQGSRAALLAREKTSDAIHLVEQKKDMAIELMHEKKDAVTYKVQEKRQAVLDWYREHRWR